MKAVDHISVEYLKCAVTYDPDTGSMKWQNRGDMPNSWNARFPGKEIGTSNKSDYIFFMIKGRRIAAHRAAWAIMTDEWPKHEVDHRDTVKSHNWWKNLRDATTSQNRQNRGRNVNNTSGYKGVTFCKVTNRWATSIGYGGRIHYIGRFDTPEEAFAAYRNEAKIHHGGFANVGDN